MDLPLWVIAVVIGVVFSAFMTVKTTRDEQKQEQEWIEQEGEVFVKRMEEERDERRDRQVSQG
ncbi:sporulation YhaL family protein [Bacillus fonticola]|uniref:sporulation YhaL family protein n=1 Tax=Bacillus fonticola TaxID=2728853 RepID=UPI001475B337|nr:sporulation YhaL family protein [Bacillus fonticola]